MDIADLINLEGLQQFIVDGAYIRSLTIKPGMVITSELWKKERLWIILEGDFTYTTYKEERRIKAPFVGLAPFGQVVNILTHEKTTIIAVTGTKAKLLEHVKEDVIHSDRSI